MGPRLRCTALVIALAGCGQLESGSDEDGLPTPSTSEGDEAGDDAVDETDHPLDLPQEPPPPVDPSVPLEPDVDLEVWCNDTDAPPPFDYVAYGRDVAHGPCGHVAYVSYLGAGLIHPDGSLEVLPGAVTTATFSRTGHLLARQELEGGDVTIRDLRDDSELVVGPATHYGFVPSSDPSVGDRMWLCSEAGLRLSDFEGETALVGTVACETVIAAAGAPRLLLSDALEDGRLHVVDTETGQSWPTDVADYSHDPLGSHGHLDLSYDGRLGAHRTDSGPATRMIDLGTGAVLDACDRSQILAAPNLDAPLFYTCAGTLYFFADEPTMLAEDVGLCGIAERTGDLLCTDRRENGQHVLVRAPTASPLALEDLGSPPLSQNAEPAGRMLVSPGGLMAVVDYGHYDRLQWSLSEGFSVAHFFPTLLPFAMPADDGVLGFGHPLVDSEDALVWMDDLGVPQAHWLMPDRIGDAARLEDGRWFVHTGYPYSIDAQLLIVHPEGEALLLADGATMRRWHLDPRRRRLFATTIPGTLERMYFGSL